MAWHTYTKKLYFITSRDTVVTGKYRTEDYCSGKEYVIAVILLGVETSVLCVISVDKQVEKMLKFKYS